MSILSYLTNLTGREKIEAKRPVTQPPAVHPVRSVVQVRFPSVNRTLAYYNDKFDLHVGDFVYVEGKLEGVRGQVVQVEHSFKIKLSDYKRVVSVADTRVSGRFYLAGDYFLAFSPKVLPYEKVSRWFRAESEEPEEYVTGDVMESVSLSRPQDFQVSPEIAERGRQYHMARLVRCLCVDRQRGRAVVEGTRGYEVEFSWNPENGTVSNIACDCPCFYHCKHEYAVLLQLQETLDLIQARYPDLYARTGYFTAVSRAAFFTFAGREDEKGSFTWNVQSGFPAF